MKEKLSKIIKDVKPQGLFKAIKRIDSDIHNKIIKIKIEYNLSYSEAIYWIMNDLHSKPACPNYSKKCIHTLRFISLKDGYSRCCKKCIMKDPISIQKYKNTLINKYGVDNVAKLESTQLKRKQTCMDKYGYESHNQNEEVKDKKKRTLKENFGVEGMANNTITIKKIQTNLKKYGTEWSTQTKINQVKRINTCMDRYGVDNVMKLDHVKDKIRRKLVDDDFLHYVNKLIESKGFKLISNYDHAHSNVTLQCNKCHHVFNILWNSFQQGGGVCPSCYPRTSGSSKQEKDISLFIQSFDVDVLENDRNIIAPLELDIVIPDKKIAIEYCGLWCHSSGGDAPYLKDKNYHINKLNLTNEKGYKLLTIFEDEWILNRDIIKSKLRYSISNQNDFMKIRASKCNIKILSYLEKNTFLKSNHLQGDKISKINIGLFYNDDLVSVMTFSQKENYYEMDRFCNKKNTIVYGGASRLLKYFKNNYNWKNIVTFADRRWSTGEVYYKLGFDLDSITQPNYWYWGKNINGRKHRLNFRKSNLKSCQNYKEELTEFQIMALEGYAWIYDCGNYKFIMHNEK